eukprot:1157920-Pelagomonas_calceolata.AAC.1
MRWKIILNEERIQHKQTKQTTAAPPQVHPSESLPYIKGKHAKRVIIIFSPPKTQRRGMPRHTIYVYHSANPALGKVGKQSFRQPSRPLASLGVQ